MNSFSHRPHWVLLDSDAGHDTIEKFYEPLIEDLGVEEFETVVGPIQDSIKSLLDDLRIELMSKEYSYNVLLLRSGPILYSINDFKHLDTFKNLANSHTLKQTETTVYYTYILLSPEGIYVFTPSLSELIRISWTGDMNEIP